MRITAVLTVLAAFLASASSSLVVIEADARSPEALAILEGAVPVHIANDYFIAICSYEVQDGPRIQVIDSGDISIVDYALVHLNSNEGLLQLADLGDMVYSRDHMALIRLDGPLTDVTTRPGIHLIRPLSAMAPPEQSRTEFHDRGYDDSVADMVAQVNEDSLKFFIMQLEDFETRHSSTDSFDMSCDWVEMKLDSYGMNAFQQPFSMSSYDCQNVVGEKQGNTYPDKYWLICGHLDSTSFSLPYSDAPGADDNASGSASVVEAARILSQYDFRYSIRFVCFGGEEQGLWGSAHYASQASAAGDDILGVVNLDMTLYGPPPNDILWVSYDLQSTGLGLAMDAIIDTYVPALVTNVEYNPGMTGSDHTSFWQNGYAAVLGIEQEFWSNPYYHDPSDILANYLIYFPFGTDCAKGAIATIAYLAEPTGPTGTGGGASEPAGPGLFISGISPNPATGSAIVTFSSPLAAGAVISVFDISGREMIRSSEPAAAGTSLLDLSGLPPGVYTVRVASSGFTDTSRLVLLR